MTAFAVTACTSPSPSKATLTVFGAASLAAALGDLSMAWESARPESVLETSTGSSAGLRVQIEQGAPGDVFMSADTANPQALLDGGLADAPLTLFATNSLIVIVPADNPAGIQALGDLSRPGVCVIAAGVSVPITSYAEQVVANLASTPAYGPDFGAGYEANVCSREDNVAAVVSKIELGEGDAAIVYGSDASANAHVRTIAIPDAANVEATYGAVVLASSASSDVAREFVAWLRGDDAQKVLARHGFGAAP